MLVHPEAVAPDLDQVGVVEQQVDEGGGYDLAAEDIARLREALV